MKMDWKEEGFEIVAEASNGKEALEIIHNQKVDIVITDMRMPKMDGVELAKRCHQEFPHVKVIVLSGYSDFDYVRNSMKQGVRDYLLKPVAPEELVETLYKIRLEIVDEKRKQVEFANINRLVHSHLQEVQEQFILHLVKEERLQLDIVKERLQQLQLYELTYGCRVQFVTVEIRDDINFSRLEELRLPFQMICKEIAKQTEGTYYFHDTNYPNMVQFLHSFTLDKDIFKLVKQVQQKVNEFLKVETVIGIGKVVNDLPEYRTGYISSLLAWSQSQVGPKSQIIDQTVTGDEVFDFTPDFEKRLTNSIENTDFSAFKENLNKILAGSEKRSVLSFSFTANQVLFILGSLAKKYNVETKDVQNMIWNCQQSIWSHSSNEKVKDYLAKLANLMINKVHVTRFSNKNLIDSIRQYLDQHYASEITLKTLSTLFHINSSHLSESFKNHVGQNFSDYLVNIRLEKAKEFLKDNELKIIDVANLVGFSNSGYFSTVFKKNFGTTPAKYRNSHIRNDSE